MSTDKVDGYSWCDFRIAIMEFDTVLVHVLHKPNNIFDRERGTHDAVAHLPPGRKLHFQILNVEGGVGKILCGSCMVIVQVGNDDVFDPVTVNVDGVQRGTRCTQ